MYMRSSLPLLTLLSLLLGALLALPTPAHAATCSRSSKSVYDPNTGQSWSAVSYCPNDGGATMYVGSNYSTPVARMNSTNSWFVCYAYGEKHSGGNTVWYYSQGDVSLSGWESRQAWGYMPAVNVGTTSDPGSSNLPQCAPDMWQQKLNVTDYAGRNWSTVWYAGNTGGAPLYLNSNTQTLAGYMDSTTSWFVCYVRDNLSHVWYYTQGDRSAANTQAWGFMSAQYVQTPWDPYDSIPPCNFTQPVNPDYTKAMSLAFGTVPSLASRQVVNTGVLPGDDGLIVMRWFIPSPGAAGGLLLGDGRSFSDAPSAAENSRIVMAWDLATGKVSVTVSPSTTVAGLPIQALPISLKSACGYVQSSDLQQRYTNDVYVGGNNGILTVCMSGLNSLTNSIDVASWSVDSDTTIQMDPDNPGAGNYTFTMLGNGYPAIEAAYYSRYQGNKSLFRRRVDPFVSRDIDAGGGLAALDLESWYRCYTVDGYASACIWDTSITPPQGVPLSSLYYFTSWTDSGN